MHLVEEAKLFHLLPDRRPDFEHSARFTPRRNAGTAQVIVSVGGEDDKVVLRSVEYWDPCTNIWKQLACLPFAVRYLFHLEKYKTANITYASQFISSSLLMICIHDIFSFAFSTALRLLL